MNTKFAFLIHPRDISDVVRRYPIVKFLPRKLTEKLILLLPPVLCSQFDVFDRAKGYLVGIAITPKQMLSMPLSHVRKRILKAVLYAQNNLGVEGIGLGAYTAPFTEGGKWLVKQPEVKIWVTHGDSYAVTLTLEGIEKLVELRRLDLQRIKIAVVGAYGTIGGPVSRELAHRKCNLILVGHSIEKFNRLIEKIGGNGNLGNIKFSENISDVVEADIIITATTAKDGLLNPEYLKQGAIVYDVSQPVNLKPDVCKKRPDVTRVDGAYAYINGIAIGFRMGTPPGTTFGCLAETIMQSLMGDKGNHIGEVEMEHVYRTISWARELGFKHAPFTNFSRRIDIAPLSPGVKIPSKKTVPVRATG